MVSRFDNLKGGDAMNLTEVVRETIGSYVFSSVKECLDAVMEDEELEESLTKHFSDEIRSTNDSFESYLNSKEIARELVDELGRLGWEVLPPESVRRVKLAVGVRRNFKFPRLKLLKRRKNGTG